MQMNDPVFERTRLPGPDILESIDEERVVVVKLDLDMTGIGRKLGRALLGRRTVDSSSLLVGHC